jgi:predicted RNA-binding protein (virulence factor B family)
LGVEVKIGVQYAVRELVLESNQSPDEVEAAVGEALKSGGLLTLVDDHGRRVVVPSDRLAYVEIGEQVERRVGFGAI